MSRPVVTCPFCGGRSAELVSLFGTQLLLSQYRCSACASYFEGLRDDRANSEPAGPARGGNDVGHRAEH